MCAGQRLDLRTVRGLMRLAKSGEIETKMGFVPVYKVWSKIDLDL